MKFADFVNDLNSNNIKFKVVADWSAICKIMGISIHPTGQNPLNIHCCCKCYIKFSDMQRNLKDREADNKQFIKMLHFQRREDHEYCNLTQFGLVISNLEYCDMHQWNNFDRNSLLNTTFSVDFSKIFRSH